MNEHAAELIILLNKQLTRDDLKSMTKQEMQHIKMMMEHWIALIEVQIEKHEYQPEELYCPTEAP